MRYKQNIGFLFVFAFLFANGISQTTTSKGSLDQYFENWIQAPNLKSASIGVLVKSASGKTIINRNAEKSLVPASIQKLFTTAAILESKGRDFQFETKLWYTGKIDERGWLLGDIWIEGGGDPTLGSERFGGLQPLSKIWLAAIRGAGIKGVSGKIRVDASMFPKYCTPRTWIWEDLGNYYGAVPAGLTFHENMYELELESPSQIGELCTVKSVYPNMVHLEFDCAVTAASGNADNAYIFGNGDNKRYIQGSIPKGRDSFTIKGSISNPEKVAASWFETELTVNGIEVKNEELSIEYDSTSKELIYTHKSPRLSEIVKLTNQYSINLYAEHLALWNSEKRGDLLSIELAAQNVKKSLEKMNISTNGLALVDGSGLSRFNAISPNQMVELLNYMKTTENADVFQESLAVAGQSGTLKRMFTGSVAEGMIKAKSGYMERVRSYAGYITTKSEEQLTFCIIINNYSGSASETKYQIKKLLEKIVQQ